MGCPSQVDLGDTLVFSVTTHDPDTGVLTDADAVPDYRIYEDETAVAILTGSMATLDAGNTTGFYSEIITCSTANGFEVGKTYTVYIEATVDGDMGGMAYTFKVVATNASLVDDIWDEVLSSGAHNTLFSAGQRLYNMTLRTGTLADDAGTNFITFPGPWSSVDGMYEQNIVSVVQGTGAGQTRLIVEYIGADRKAYVDRDWDVVPLTGDIVELLPFSGVLLAQHGIAQAGAVDSITLATSALTDASSYIGCLVFITTGTGAGQTRLITGYTAGRVATVSPDWETNPDNTSVYKVIPVGRSIVDTLGSDAIVQVAAALSGAGAITWSYTLTDADTGNPIDGASVWVTTDSAGTNVIASGTTNDSGVVTFYLDAGLKYIWRSRSGYNFDNPDTEVIS